MPIYEYKCRKCNKVFEKLTLSQGDAKVECDSCGSSDVEKIFSSFSSTKSSTKNSVPPCANGGCCPGCKH
ncbi:zinc ribbon domain-containing protein [Elusimicrobiota bacterium]